MLKYLIAVRYTLLIVLCFLFLGDGNSQSRRKRGNTRKITSYLKLENAVNYRPNLGLTFTDYRIGLVKQNDTKYSEINLFYKFYEKDFLRLGPGGPSGSLFKGHSYGLEYYRAIRQIKINSLFVNFGLQGSINYLYKIAIPYRITGIAGISSECYCLSISPKAIVMKKLGINTAITLSSNFNLINIGYGIDRIKNPNVSLNLQRNRKFNMDFLREYFQFGLGINFKL